jgi:5'-nucleotidase (lipoprotein e(P4) family)
MKRLSVLALALPIWWGTSVLGTSALAQEQSGDEAHNALVYALAWKQTAAEYQALYFQGFNIARAQVQAALERQQAGDKPLAVVTDVDDTVLHSLTYWGHLVQRNLDFFDDAIWDRWVESNRVTATPGAMEFLQFCAANGVEVFYVTSRDQGENTFTLALENLHAVGFPFVDEEHVTVLRDSSNKETRQDALMEQYNVVTFLGDNLNDFRRKYYIRSDVDGRLAAMEEDKDKFGSEYVIFPNPTDGHWLAAIFGDSEPAATDANREILKEAASRQRWDDPMENARNAYYEGNFTEALAIWRPLAEQGNARAQNNLGILYRNGEGLVQDYEASRLWLLQAAAKGHARSQFILGTMYDYGQGVAQDYATALRWYLQAAASGDVDAQFNIAVLYSSGRGVASSPAEAARWYALAAEQGDSNAQNILGRMYMSGEGVEKNEQEALRLFKLAAAQGHELARENIATYFSD